MTPWILDLLNKKGVKATFFCVGDNVRKYPHLFERIIREGHAVGNHTYHHLQGLYTETDRYLQDVEEADLLIGSRLFRPPHGLLRWSQLQALKKRGYIIVMQDVVTRDYSKQMTPEKSLQIVKDYTRDGSIIVFHDSLRSRNKLPYALSHTIDYLRGQGYELDLVPDKNEKIEEVRIGKRLVI